MNEFYHIISVFNDLAEKFEGLGQSYLNELDKLAEWELAGINAIILADGIFSGNGTINM